MATVLQLLSRTNHICAAPIFTVPAAKVTFTMQFTCPDAQAWLTGLNSTSIATPGMPITLMAWSMPPLATPTWRSAVHVNSDTSPLVRLPATPSTAAMASEEEHTMAALLDRPLPAGRGSGSRASVQGSAAAADCRGQRLKGWRQFAGMLIST